MIHIKAYPPRILYQSPYRSAQISDLADIHLTFRFQAALPVIVSPAQRSSKTGRRAQSEIIFQAILPWFYFGKFLTKLQIWHEFHSHFFCFLSLYDTTGIVVLILSVLALLSSTSPLSTTFSTASICSRISSRRSSKSKPLLYL